MCWEIQVMVCLGTPRMVPVQCLVWTPGSPQKQGERLDTLRVHPGPPTAVINGQDSWLCQPAVFATAGWGTHPTSRLPRSQVILGSLPWMAVYLIHSGSTGWRTRRCGLIVYPCTQMSSPTLVRWIHPHPPNRCLISPIEPFFFCAHHT